MAASDWLKTQSYDRITCNVTIVCNYLFFVLDRKFLKVQSTSLLEGSNTPYKLLRVILRNMLHDIMIIIWIDDYCRKPEV